MRTFTHKEKTYKLTEKDYKQLLKRFDVSRAKETPYKMVIEERCICLGRVCRRCCLGEQAFGCIDLLDEIIGLTPIKLNLAVDYIYWPKDSPEAPEYITKVREMLLTLEKK